MKKLLIALCIVILSTASVCAEETAALGKSYSPYAGSDQPRNVYWGDTHLHTTYSPDAGLVNHLTRTAIVRFRIENTSDRPIALKNEGYPAGLPARPSNRK